MNEGAQGTSFLNLHDGSSLSIPHEMTVAEFDELCSRLLTLPQWPDVELIRGRTFVRPHPSPLHQVLKLHLHKIVGEWLKAREADRVFMQLAYDICSTPLKCYLGADLMLVPLPALNHERSLLPEGVIPPLVLEVLDDPTAHLDLGVRRDILAELGVPEYWTCDPFTGAVMVFTLTDGKYERDIADSEGYVWSPFFRHWFKIQVEPWRFTVLTRTSKTK